MSVCNDSCQLAFVTAKQVKCGIFKCTENYGLAASDVKKSSKPENDLHIVQLMPLPPHHLLLQ